ncbi:MAG: TolC family protein [Flavobacteriales bacterium]|nr:TolC family protein [Flavobacteriales bacterium]
MKLFRISLLLVTSMLFGSQIRAQENLSLKDAVTLGLSNNFQIQIAEKNTTIAERNNNWMEAGAFPSITAKASESINWSENNNPASFIQGRSTSTSTSFGADLNWVIFNGFKVHVTKAKLQQLQEQSEGNAAVVVENTIQSIILGYYNALLQQEKLKALANVVKVSSDRYDYVMAKKELGTASTFDLLQVKNAMLMDSTNFLMQELAYKNALRNLNMLMAVDVEKQYELTDELAHEKVVLSLDGMKEKMMSSNQTLKNQYINQVIMKKDAGIAKANLFPVVSFGTGISHSINGFDGTGLGGIKINSSGNTSLSYYANVSLSFTIFNGRKAYRAFKNLQIQEEISDLTTQEMELTLSNELITAYELYNARLTIMNLSDQSLETAELNLKLAEDKYKSGSISSFEFRDIQTAYLNTIATQLEAVFNALSAHTDLVRMTGGIVEEFNQ